MPIPPGFTTLFPYLIVADADDYMDFLIAAFGGVEIGRHRREDGKLANGQVKFGDTTIMVGEASTDFPSGQVNLYFYIENPDAAIACALAHGATLISEVSDKPYGDRQGGVSDPRGNIWWISQHLSDAPYF